MCGFGSSSGGVLTLCDWLTDGLLAGHWFGLG